MTYLASSSCFECTETFPFTVREESRVETVEETASESELAGAGGSSAEGNLYSSSVSTRGGVCDKINEDFPSLVTE